MKFGRGITACLTAVCVGVATVPPPTAQASQHYTLTFLRWGGPNYCLWVTSPSYGNYWATSMDYVCDDNREIVVNTPALSGQWIGADPVIDSGISWAGCSLIIDGKLDWADYADNGDGTDVNCLRILK